MVLIASLAYSLEGGSSGIVTAIPILGALALGAHQLRTHLLSRCSLIFSFKNKNYFFHSRTKNFLELCRLLSYEIQYSQNNYAPQSELELFKEKFYVIKCSVI